MTNWTSLHDLINDAWPQRSLRKWIYILPYDSTRRKRQETD